MAMCSANVFIITCTENGYLHVVDVDTGTTIQSIKHTPKSHTPENKEILKVKFYNFGNDSHGPKIGICCMDGTVKVYKVNLETCLIDENKPIFEKTHLGVIPDFDIDRKNPNVLA